MKLFIGWTLCFTICFSTLFYFPKKPIGLMNIIGLYIFAPVGVAALALAGIIAVADRVDSICVLNCERK